MPLSSDDTTTSSIKWSVEIVWTVGERPGWAYNLYLTISDFQKDSKPVNLFSDPLYVERNHAGPEVDVWICRGVIQEGNHLENLTGLYPYNIHLGHRVENATGEPIELSNDPFTRLTLS